MIIYIYIDFIAWNFNIYTIKNSKKYKIWLSKNLKHFVGTKYIAIIKGIGNYYKNNR